MDKKHYVLTKGIYEDRHIIAVVRGKKLAKQCIENGVAEDFEEAEYWTEAPKLVEVLMLVARYCPPPPKHKDPNLVRELLPAGWGAPDLDYVAAEYGWLEYERRHDVLTGDPEIALRIDEERVVGIPGVSGLRVSGADHKEVRMVYAEKLPGIKARFDEQE
jgi:hypothetical protein